LFSGTASSSSGKTSSPFSLSLSSSSPSSGTSGTSLFSRVSGGSSSPGGGSGGSSSIFGGSGFSGGSGSSIISGTSTPATTGGIFKTPRNNNKKQPKVNVFVRERGKQIKINKKPVTVAKGKRLGAKVVDNTARASFELRSTNKRKLRETSSPKKFFGKKTKIGLFFKERNQFRIDTPGEKKELSVSRYLKERGDKL